MNTLDAALEYSRRGWCIIPMRITDDEKKPALRWKQFQEERPTERKLREWFGNDSTLGLGVIFGAVSGHLGSRDFDSMDAFSAWANRYPQLASRLPTVETARGRHLYFRTDPTVMADLRNAMGKPLGYGAIDCGDGELRAGVGCYSVLPPSRRPNGKGWNWLAPPNELVVVDPLEAGLVTLNREEQRALKTLSGEGELETNIDYELVAPPNPLLQCLENSLSPVSSLLSEQIERAIQRTIPTQGGRRHKAIFQFARELKSLPEFAQVSAKVCKPFVKQWHARAKPYMRTKEFEETWFDFAEAWPKIKYTVGEEPIVMIFSKALEAELPEVAQQYEQQKLRQFVAFCRELQRAAGDQPFFLASRVGSRLFDVSHVTIAHWLRGLEVDGVIQCAQRGKIETGQASRYRYLGAI